MLTAINKQILESIQAKQGLLDSPETIDTIKEVVDECVRTYRNKGKVLLAGNGGSAADAQHIAAEFVGRFDMERPALPAIALNVNTSVITAVANDYAYADVFKRQVDALASSRDLFIGISTSGNSSNVLNAVEACCERGLTTVGLTGRSGGKLSRRCDYSIMVPSDSVPRIQESHIMIMHIVCAEVEKTLFGRNT